MAGINPGPIHMNGRGILVQFTWKGQKLVTSSWPIHVDQAGVWSRQTDHKCHITSQIVFPFIAEDTNSMNKCKQLHSCYILKQSAQNLLKCGLILTA